jgi:CheY-like chemotaxis protein
LPATTKGNSAPVAVGQTATHRGQETILLVEDDAPLRVVAVRVLSRMGYRILEADNGLAAMKLWQDYAGQIDLLFSDMVMPEGLTGLDLAEKLRAKKPSLKVIITSGYNADLAGQATPTAGGIRYLQKPYPIEILSKVVRECLDNQIFLDGKKIH